MSAANNICAPSEKNRYKAIKCQISAGLNICEDKTPVFPMLKNQIGQVMLVIFACSTFDKMCSSVVTLSGNYHPGIIFNSSTPILNHTQSKCEIFSLYLQYIILYMILYLYFIFIYIYIFQFIFVKYQPDEDVKSLNCMKFNKDIQ